MRTLRTSVVLLGVLAGGPALATDLASCQITPEQQAEHACLCVGPIASPFAYLDQVKGDVWKSTQADYSPVASSPSALLIGDKVVFSSDGQGVVMTANCQAPVGPNATLVVYQLEGGCGCAALVEDPKPVAKHHGGALLVGAAALIGAKVLIHSISP